MENSLQITNSQMQPLSNIEGQEKKQFLTMRIGSQAFGIPVVKIRDVLRPQQLTKIPLSKPQILGLINLRGKIVTVIDVRRCLGLESNATQLSKHSKNRMVVVEHKNELYSLVIDEVGDVLDLPLSQFEKIPENLSPVWKEVSQGVFKLKSLLLLILDVEHLLDI